jgi:hypothetical protein
MRLFHIHFSNTEATRFVVDEWLKETMRRSLKKMLFPLYAKLIGRFKDVIGMDVADQHIKYKLSDLEDRLTLYFQAYL